MNDIEWKSVPGFEGLYEANERGEVRSIDRRVNYKARMQDGKTVLRKGKVLAPQHDKIGYVHYIFTKNNKRYLVKGHHVIAMVYLGWRKGMHENGLYVTHLNGKKDDNRLSNLTIKEIGGTL